MKKLITVFILLFTILIITHSVYAIEQILFRENFEEDFSDRISSWSTSSGNLSLADSSDIAPSSGDYSLKMNRAAWHNAIVSPEVTLEKDVQYDFSVWVKMSEGSSTKFRIYTQNQALVITSNVSINSTEWTNIRVAYTLPSSLNTNNLTTKIAFQIQDSASGTSAYYIDDFKISYQGDDVKTVSIEGEDTINVPMNGTASYEYGYTVKVNGEIADNETVTLSLQGDAINGITFDSHTNSINVSSNVTSGEIILKAVLDSNNDIISTKKIYIINPYSNFFKYANFEEGKLDEFSAGGGTISIEGTGYNSTKSMKVGRSLYFNHVKTKNIIFEKGEKYYFSFMIKTQATEYKQFRVYMEKNSSELISNVAINSEWKKVTFEYTPAEDITTALIMQIRDTVNPAESFFIDNVNINRLGYPVPPVATDVRITGVISVGSEVEGEYTFTDENNDSELGSIYRWLVSESISGEYLPIENATDKKYTLSINDTNKYIIFEVTPIDNSGEKGVAVKSKPITTIQFPPEAINVKVTGETFVGSQISVSYDYYDINNDNETGTVFKWYRENNAGIRSIIEGATSKAYTVQEADKAYYLIASIIPKDETNNSGVETFSQKFGSIRIAPIAKDVSIEIVANGKVLKGNYTFYDANVTDVETGSEYLWSVSDNGVSYIDLAIKTISLEEADSYKGKYIKFSVLPRSSNEPAKGLRTYSEAYLVPDKTSDKGGSYNVKGVKGGGSGGGFSIITPLPAPEPEPEKEEIAIPIANINAISFKDIENHWAKDTILYLASIGIVNGVSKESFEPNAKITRAQLASLIIKVKKLTIRKYMGGFKDVDESQWFCDVVQTVADAKIMNGNGAFFNPNEYITRQEMAKVIVLALNKDISSENEIKFEDKNEISDWALRYVGVAEKLGLIKGNDNKEFNPLSSLTRAEATTIIHRMLREGV